MKTLLCAAAALVVSASASLAALPVDSGTTLICTLVDVASCEPGNGCQRETAESINAPQLLTVDQKAGEIRGRRANGELLTTKIDRAGRQGDLLVLDGAQGPLSWTVTITDASGRMSLAAIGDGMAYMAFGSCEPK